MKAKQIKRKLSLVLIVSVSLFLLQGCLGTIIGMAVIQVKDGYRLTHSEKDFGSVDVLKGRNKIYIQSNIFDNSSDDDLRSKNTCVFFTKTHPEYECSPVMSSEIKHANFIYENPVDGEKALFLHIKKIKFFFLEGTTYEILAKKMDTGKTIKFTSPNFFAYGEFRDYVNEYLERLFIATNNKTEKTKNEN
jgi:hypothetical protein